MNPHKAYNILLLAALAALPAHAQNGAEEKVLDVDFSVFPLESSNWEGILYAPDGDPKKGTQELRFNPHQRTLGFSYRGPAPIRFYREVINEEGLTDFEIVGQVAPGTGVLRDDLILFFSPEKEDGPYDISFMFDSPKAFPDESLVFFNSMNITFEGILGDKRFTLKPGASAPLDVSAFFDAPTPIMLVLEHDNDYHRVLKNKVRFSPERRTLMILRSPKNPDSLRIRTQRLTEYTGPRGSTEEPGA